MSQDPQIANVSTGSLYGSPASRLCSTPRVFRQCRDIDVDNTKRLTQVTGSGAVRRLEISIEINAPIQSLWNALVDSRKVEIWWTGGTIETYEGGRFILDDGAEVNGTVKVCHAPYIFEFTWNDSPEKSGHPALIDPHTKSMVRFDLTDLTEERTLLHFIQYLPFAEIVGAAAGWHQIIGERLKDFIETGKVCDDPNRFSELKSLYEDSSIK